MSDYGLDNAPLADLGFAFSLAEGDPISMNYSSLHPVDIVGDGPIKEMGLRPIDDVNIDMPDHLINEDFAGIYNSANLNYPSLIASVNPVAPPDYGL
ncbi:hypothetical protein BWQ96_05929 [Gracilariopsis chorda]|uniref:Uncharacterized protein n=1 Tax=Gracilariopsis chorda TaxID=448386 RepID=A0A2V3IQC9_9FLOR|nr:hypothetical protein BWQ96_05929 [Gracilariopsis chorda]|eukprot:PXF44302.1 hypothetical protein BWQ96_05929 [Gracilariopsis chorda]